MSAMIQSAMIQSAMIRNSSTCFLMLLLAPLTIADDGAEQTATENAAVESVAVEKAPVEDTAELSVAPLDHISYPEDRPQWVADADDGKPFALIDDNKIVIVSRLSDTPQQCEERLTISARVAVEQYVIDLVDFVADTSFYEFTDDQIKDLITRQYDGTAKQGDMTMHQRAIELTFTPEKQREIKAASANIEVSRRLRRMGGIFVGGLLALFGSSAVIGTVSRFRCKKQQTVS